MGCPEPTHPWVDYFCSLLEAQLAEHAELPPMLVLHGLFGSGDNWQSHSRVWKTQRLVVAPDLPCHGAPGTARDLGYAAMAELIATGLRRVYNQQTWIVLGHSMGGKVAMALALGHQDLVERLIVADIAPKPYRPHHNKVFDALRSVDLSALKTRADAAPSLLRYLPEPAMVAFFQKNLIPPESSASWRWRFNLTEIEAAYDLVVAWDIGPPVAPSAVGTLVVWGGRSDYVVAEDRDSLFGKYFSSIEWVCLSDAGHWVHVEGRQRFLEVIDDFLGRLT